MKNTRLFIPIALLIILVGLVFTLIIFKSLLGSNAAVPATGDNPVVLSDDISVSSSIIFFQGTITNLPNVPQNTIINPLQTSGLSVYWIEQSSIQQGNNTCSLYDSATNQIYATRYKTNGQFGGRPEGTMYYINKIIDEKKSLEILDSTCFK